jgi:hypothetical protein
LGGAITAVQAAKGRISRRQSAFTADPRDKPEDDGGCGRAEGLGTATGCRALLCRELVFKRGFPMTLGTILIIILILILLGAVPSWPYSRGWGYGPSGIVGIILVILIILVLLGRI